MQQLVGKSRKTRNFGKCSAENQLERAGGKMNTGDWNDLFLRYLRISEKEKAEKSPAMVTTKQTPEQKTNNRLASPDENQDNAANGKCLKKQKKVAAGPLTPKG